VLTDDERREIVKEIERHPHRKAASISALKIVQRHRGWISDELRDIAELLGMTPEELGGIASFFSHIYLRPPGKHIIFACDSISCWVSGYDTLREHLAKLLGIKPGETTSDGQFTLMPIACLGVCEKSPAMLIDDELYTGLNTEKIDEILRKYR
jgi:NADH-quinone oxidoreductase subunit E